MTIMTKLVASVACLSVLATAPAFARIDGERTDRGRVKVEPQA